MRILWDCRSLAKHMGGIAHAAADWLGAFLGLAPKHWQLTVLHSSGCDQATLQRLVPELEGNQVELHAVDAGFIAPRFEQLQLPTLLERRRIDLYFNPGFTLPAVKTTRFQVSVVHDVIFFDHPEWVAPPLQRIFASATDLAMRRADACSRFRLVAGAESPSRVGRTDSHPLNISMS